MVSRITVNEFELAVRDQGKGLPLLLIHGFPLDGRMWDAQLEHFSRSYRVIVPDLAGFGQSAVPQPDSTVSMPQYAAQLAGLLDAIQVTEPVVLCGLSMGGYIAMEFVRSFADRLGGLVLCDTRTRPDPPEVAENRRKLAATIDQKGLPGLAEAMLPKLFAPANLEKAPSQVALVTGMIIDTAPTGIAAAARGMADRVDTTDLLPGVTVPSLVIVGEHDIPSPRAEMREIADAMPRSTFVELPDAGHMTPLEQTDRFNAALEQYLIENF